MAGGAVPGEEKAKRFNDKRGIGSGVHLKKLAILALFAAFLMFGCMGLGETDTSSGGVALNRPALAPAITKTLSESSSSDSVSQAQYVTKTGQITIKVPEGALEDKFAQMKTKLLAEGAQMSDIRYNEYSDQKQYTLTVKVQPERFDRINEMLKTIGEVKGLSVQLEDVTKQYVELDLRIKNREIELERLYDLYNKSDNVSDLLAVEREITRVESDLEILKQEKESLVSQVERSTIAITIYEEKPAADKLTIPLEELGALFFGAMAAAITVIVGLTGFVLPLAVVFALLWFAYKKIRGKKG